MDLGVRYGEEGRHVFLGKRRKRRREEARERGREGHKEGREGRETETGGGTYRKILRWTAFILAKLEAKY